MKKLLLSVLIGSGLYAECADEIIKAKQVFGSHDNTYYSIKSKGKIALSILNRAELTCSFDEKRDLETVRAVVIWSTMNANRDNLREPQNFKPMSKSETIIVCIPGEGCEVVIIYKRNA